MIENKLDKVALTWLNNNFGNLKPVVMDNETYYVNEDRLPLFYYYQDEKNGFGYINYNEIWLFFETFFGMEYKQIQGVIRDWLEETYNLKGLTPYIPKGYEIPSLEETYNLKGLTPYKQYRNLNEMLEETYNLKGLTPDI